ncbi:BTB/POZ protein, partial [Ochromonadaceae sp. CCMP2298]
KQQWEAEKAALAGVQHFESVVKLDVGGVRYTTTLTTLRRFPDSMIGCMFSGRHALSKGEDGYFFIDRDGTHFRHILNFLRSPKGYKVAGVADAEKEELRRECEYYGIDQWVFAIPYTEKLLQCEWVTPTDKIPIAKNPNLLTAIPDSVQLAVLVDPQGVYTVRGERQTGKTERQQSEFFSDGKIEYCPRCHIGFCHKGAAMYWAVKFHEKCEGGVSAAQPRVQGPCLECKIFKWVYGAVGANVYKDDA